MASSRFLAEGRRSWVRMSVESEARSWEVSVRKVVRTVQSVAREERSGEALGRLKKWRQVDREDRQVESVHKV